MAAAAAVVAAAVVAGVAADRVVACEQRPCWCWEQCLTLVGMDAAAAVVAAAAAAVAVGAAYDNDAA